MAEKNRAEVLAAIKAICAEDGYDVTDWRENSTIKEISLDSLDQMALALKLEMQFDVYIKELDNNNAFGQCQTIGDLVDLVMKSNR